MASSDGSTQPKKKKKRIKSKNKDEPCAFESSSISFSQHLMNPINFSMNNQPYYMSSNMQNTPMPMMASPLVTSPEQQMHFRGHLMPYPTPISAPTMSTTPQWASELEEEKIFLKFHPPFFFFLAWWPSWLEVVITGHNFGRGPSTDYSTKVWLQLDQWFLRRRFLCEFPIGSYIKLSSAVGAILVEGPNRRTHFWKRTIQ
jgi:hypothetical protein